MLHCTRTTYLFGGIDRGERTAQDQTHGSGRGRRLSRCGVRRGRSGRRGDGRRRRAPADAVAVDTGGSDEAVPGVMYLSRGGR